MKRRIEEGRFIPVGGMWVEADGMLPARESPIRQIAYGRKYYKEHLGVQPKGVWLPDSFGDTGAWPTRSPAVPGTNGSSRRRSRGTTPPSSLPPVPCGKASTARAPPPASRRRNTYAAWCKVQELDYAEKNFQDKDLADRSLLPFGFGDGGGGPTRNMMEHLHRYENLEERLQGEHRRAETTSSTRPISSLQNNAGPENARLQGRAVPRTAPWHLDLATGHETRLPPRGIAAAHGRIPGRRPPRWPTRTTTTRARSWTAYGRPCC